MGTTNHAIALDVIAGVYDEDQPTKIVTYNNMFDGGLTYAVVFEHEYQMRYEESPACRNVKIFWTKTGGLA